MPALNNGNPRENRHERPSGTSDARARDNGKRYSYRRIGEPLPGATVTKGTALGTVTNFDGTFSFLFRQSYLVFFVCKYTSLEMNGKGNGTGNIMLIPETTNNHLVVIGHGTQRSRRHGSVAIINTEDEKGLSPNIQPCSRGRFPAFKSRPTASPVPTPRFASAPGRLKYHHYVIDGVPMGTTIRDFTQRH